MRTRTVLIALLLACITLLDMGAGCQRMTRNTRAADEQAIRAADTDLFKAVQEKNLDGVVSFYAEDASLFPVEEPIAIGRKAIRENWEHALSIPGFNTRWQISKIAVSRSGDLAYAQGSYQTAMEDREGKPVTEVGKWVTVFRKDHHGTWKAVADITNTDSAPPIHKPPRALE
jgi:uncharacterized protein (TIGR02246 family)